METGDHASTGQKPIGRRAVCGGRYVVEVCAGARAGLGAMQFALRWHQSCAGGRESVCAPCSPVSALPHTRAAALMCNGPLWRPCAASAGAHTRYPSDLVYLYRRSLEIAGVPAPVGIGVFPRLAAIPAALWTTLLCTLVSRQGRNRAGSGHAANSAGQVRPRWPAFRLLPVTNYCTLYCCEGGN